MHFNIELQHNSDIRKFQLIEDVVFNVHQLPIAVQSSLVSNSDHSWNFPKNIEK